MNGKSAAQWEHSFVRTEKAVNAALWFFKNILATALCIALMLAESYAAYRFVLWTGAPASLALWTGIAALLFFGSLAVFPCTSRVESALLTGFFIAAPLLLAAAVAILAGYAAHSFWLGFDLLLGLCTAATVLLGHEDFDFDHYAATVALLLRMLLSLLAALAAGAFLYRCIEPRSYGVAAMAGLFAGAFVFGLLYLCDGWRKSVDERLRERYDPARRMEALVPSFGESDLAALSKGSGYDSVRKLAMLRLVEFADRDALLADAKNGAFSSVAERAFARLCEAGDADAFADCAANSQNKKVREQAALCHVENLSRDALLGYAKNSEFSSVAERAFARLVEAGDREAVVDCAKHSGCGAVRAAAERRHIPFADRKALLGYAKNSEFSSVAEQAFARLVEAGDREAIADCAKHSAHAAVKNAAAMRYAALATDDELPQLAIETEYLPAAQTAVRRLIKTGNRAALQECKQSAHFSVRHDAALALIELADLPELLKSVGSSEFSGVQERALERITEIAVKRRDEAVTAQAVALIEKLLDGGDKPMRLAAADAAKALYGADLLQVGQAARLNGRRLVARVDEDHSYSDDNCECGHDDYSDYTDVAEEYLRF